MHSNFHIPNGSESNLDCWITWLRSDHFGLVRLSKKIGFRPNARHLKYCHRCHFLPWYHGWHVHFLYRIRIGVACLSSQIIDWNAVQIGRFRFQRTIRIGWSAVAAIIRHAFASFAKPTSGIETTFWLFLRTNFLVCRIVWRPIVRRFHVRIAVCRFICAFVHYRFWLIVGQPKLIHVLRQLVAVAS